MEQILIIDDDIELTSLIKEYLENHTFKVAIQNNTWHDRATEMQQKFQEVCN